MFITVFVVLQTSCPDLGVIRAALVMPSKPHGPETGQPHICQHRDALLQCELVLQDNGDWYNDKAKEHMNCVGQPSIGDGSDTPVLWWIVGLPPHHPQPQLCVEGSMAVVASIGELVEKTQPPVCVLPWRGQTR